MIADPAIVSSRRSTRVARRFKGRLLCAVAFIAIGALALGISGSVPVRGADATQSSAGGGDGSAPQDSPPEANGPRRVVKLIPDQKAYVGSPPTRMDLAAVFKRTKIAERGGPLSFEVVYNKKDKHVGAHVDGGELVLEWKTPGQTEVVVRASNSHGQYVDNKFQAEVWEADYWALALTVIGGLGIFLLGMKNMSNGLQAVAGDGLRRMIAFVTDNRLAAVGAGAVATMVVQSSSITTVMTVGFVNSGFMQLQQAIGVIMGANIGTTVTGWILVLKIGKYGLPIFGACVFGYLFAKNDRLRFLSMAGMGLGMIFFGLEVMKDGFGMIKDLPEFEAWFQTFAADNYLGVLKCASVGCILTFVVQSSSATLGITIGLAQIGVIPFETAAALVLGENIGTTITAWLASFGATTNAKRAAYFHVLFNIVGVAYITALFQVYFPAVKQVVVFLGGLDPVTGQIDVTEGIAATHTGFNVFNTLVFLPFVTLFARLLERVVPERAPKETPHLTSLDIRILETPAIAVEQSRVEILRMADGCRKMMTWLKELLAQDEPDRQLVQKLFHREEVLDTVQDEVAAFMTNLLAGNVPHTIVTEGRRQLRMADEYESISDYIASILKFHLKLREQGERFDQQHLDDLLQLHDMVDTYLQLVNEGVQHRHPEVITKANSVGSEVTHRVKLLRDRHLDALTEEKMSPFVNLAYTSMLNSYRRVRDHAKNIAEALAGEK